MLARPLTDTIIKTCIVLEKSLDKSPLPVCLLAGAFTSPSVSSLLTDTVAKRISGIQRVAASEWAKRTARDLAPALSAIPRPGAALSYLIKLENAVLEAAGHVAIRPLDMCLQAEAFATVVAHFQSVLRPMDVESGTFEQRTATEARAELLFRDFCLLSRVLSTSGHSETRRLCLTKMSPIKADAARKQIDKENEILLYQSRELIKVISGGNRMKDPVNAEFDPAAHCALLFRS
jgi:hypothetical protein